MRKGCARGRHRRRQPLPPAWCGSKPRYASRSLSRRDVLRARPSPPADYSPLELPVHAIAIVRPCGCGEHEAPVSEKVDIDPNVAARYQWHGGDRRQPDENKEVQ